MSEEGTEEQKYITQLELETAEQEEQINTLKAQLSIAQDDSNTLRNQLAAKSGQPARIKDLLEKVDELEERLAAETEAFNVGQVDIEKLKSQLTSAQEEAFKAGREAFTLEPRDSHFALDPELIKKDWDWRYQTFADWQASKPKDRA